MGLMDRDIFKHLVSWKNSSYRKPLLLRGARQIGKTFTVRQFAKKHFSHLIEINFELQPQYKEIFQNLDATLIIKKLELDLKRKIDPDSTLIFLDEVQECPRAIMSLRYFFEKIPQFYVIAAGSLLEFAMEAENFRMPVGRVESLFMCPCSFGEFLKAMGRDDLVDYIHELSFKTEFSSFIHDLLLGYFKKYLMVGGMPEVVFLYGKNPETFDFGKTQQHLIQTYRDDFGKYAGRAQIPHLHMVYNSLPLKVGEIYKYSSVDPHSPSRDLKAALHLLERAGVLSRIHATSAVGFPLIKDIQEKKFKVLFIDVGLMQQACGLTAEIFQAQDIIIVNQGSVAEQFIGQQLLAQRDPILSPELYFWARDKKGSEAEVDYLVILDSKIFPIEVKAGQTGTLKSLRLFLQEHPNTPFGIRFSQLPLSFHDRVLSIPFYAIEEWKRLTHLCF